MKIANNTCQWLRVASTELCGKNVCIPIADIMQWKLGKDVAIPRLRYAGWEQEMNIVYV